MTYRTPLPHATELMHTIGKDKPTAVVGQGSIAHLVDHRLAGIDECRIFGRLCFYCIHYAAGIVSTPQQAHAKTDHHEHFHTPGRKAAAKISLTLERIQRLPSPFPKYSNMRIFLVGFMGSGKSYTGRRLAELVGLPFIDLDDEIVRRAGNSINSIFARHGEKHFRELERSVLEDLLALPSYVMATGGGTPCYADAIEIMSASGVTVFIDPTVDILLERLERGRHHRPLLQAPVALRTFITDKLTERRPCYEKATYHVRVDDPQDDVARLIHDRLPYEPHS
jgi:shikimate kinase